MWELLCKDGKSDPDVSQPPSKKEKMQKSTKPKSNKLKMSTKSKSAKQKSSTDLQGGDIKVIYLYY